MSGVFKDQNESILTGERLVIKRQKQHFDEHLKGTVTMSNEENGANDKGSEPWKPSSSYFDGNLK